MTTKLHQNMANGYEVKIGNYLSKGFEIFKANAGGYIGYAVLYFIISTFVNFIPFVNILASLLISPCLVFGFYLVSKSVSTDSSIPPFGEFFRGFDYFGKLVVVTILSGLAYLVCAIPLIIAVGVSAFSLQDANPQEILSVLIGGPLFILIFTGCAFIYLGVGWVFASMLAVFHDLSAWDALETSRKLITKNWFMVFIFLVLVGIIVMAGMLLFVIGLIVTVPLAFCYIYAAFEDIAGIPGGEIEEDNIEGIGLELS